MPWLKFLKLVKTMVQIIKNVETMVEAVPLKKNVAVALPNSQRNISYLDCWQKQFQEVDGRILPAFR